MNRLLPMTVSCALLLFAACSTDDGGDPIAEINEPCAGDGQVCSWDQGRVLKCTNGVLELLEDCSAQTKTCKEGACVADEELGGDCTGTGSACAGDKIVVCDGGTWTETSDCAAQGKECVEESDAAV